MRHSTMYRFGGFGLLLAIMAIGILNTSSAWSQGVPDVIIRDCPSDIGNQPDWDCGTICNSQDIWVRNQPDGFTNQFQQNPIAGQPAYVYVRLTNVGASHFSVGQLNVYFGSASTSMSNWPTRWISYYESGVIKGDEIGSLCVGNLDPGQSDIYMIPWASVPSNASGDHFCLIARLVSNEDPMATPEGLYIWDNVRNNNNIAWKNLCHIDPNSTSGTIAVYNGHPECGNVANTTLHFDVDQTKGDGNVLDKNTVTVYLDDLGYQIWLQGGSQGEGIGAPQADHGIRIVSPHASIGGLQLAASQGFTARVDVQITEQPGRVYYWNVTQNEEGRDEALGGEVYQIVTTPGDDVLVEGKNVRKSAPDLGMSLDLKAQPNMSKADTKVTFTLPADTRITLAIYDASGQLVRTLVADENQAAGHHEVAWDGTSASGTLVPSGTYFYHLNTAEGMVEKQIKIVR